MKAKRSKYRLSPNEEAQLVKDETERRRKQRIIQVRKAISACLKTKAINFFCHLFEFIMLLCVLPITFIIFSHMSSF